MKQLLGALLIAFATTATLAQPPNRDELVGKLQSIHDNDSSKAQILNTIARTFVREHKDSAIIYFHSAINLAHLQEAHLLEVNTLSFLSMTHALYGQYDSAIYHLETAKTISQKNDLDSALHQVYFGLGNVVESTGDLTSALEYYIKALKYFDSNKMDKSATRAKANMAYIYMKTNDLDKAYQLTIESNSFYQEVGATRQLMNGYSRLGTIFSLQSRYDSSIYYANKALDIAISMKDKLTVNTLTMNLANAQFKSKDYKSSAENYEQVVPYLENDAKNPGDLLNIYSSLMVCKMIAGTNKESDYYAEKANKILPDVTKYIDRMGLYKNLFMRDSIKGDMNGAISNYQQYIQLKDSLFNEEKSNQIALMETRFKTEKVEAEKTLAENRAELAESESQRNMFLFTGAVTISILIVLVAIFYNSKLKQTKRAEIAMIELKSSQKQLALEKQYRDSELKALKAQMNPHFIFNVLNSIQEFIIMNQKELASDYLATFADLIRSYLHFSNKGYISLEEEAETLEKYLELEALRFGDGFSYSINVNEELPSEDYRIPTMIIQPYVENAIKHGLFSKKGDRNLTVDFTITENGDLNCLVTDNGIGREAAQKIKESKSSYHKSFAMEATATRLELFNQRSLKKIDVKIIDLIDVDGNAKGTQVSLIIPSQS